MRTPHRCGRKERGDVKAESAQPIQPWGVSREAIAPAYQSRIVVHGEWLGPALPAAGLGFTIGERFPSPWIDESGDWTVVALAHRTEWGASDFAIAERFVTAEGSACTVWRVPVDVSEVAAYREGFASQGVQPARTYGRPFRSDDFHVYCTVNRRCAATLCAAAQPGSWVFIDDFHLALVPQLARHGLVASTIVVRWAVPWPCHDACECSPWGLTIVEGLLGADLVLFTTPQDRYNFLRTVRHWVDATVDLVSGIVAFGDRRVLVRLDPQSS
jgi:trehalose-6-phosphate synthase